jgi:hypothetical protein
MDRDQILVSLRERILPLRPYEYRGIVRKTSPKTSSPSDSHNCTALATLSVYASAAIADPLLRHTRDQFGSAPASYSPQASTFRFSIAARASFLMAILSAFSPSGTVRSTSSASAYKRAASTQALLGGEPPCPHAATKIAQASAAVTGMTNRVVIIYILQY